MALRYIVVVALIFVCVEAFSNLRVNKRSLANNSANASREKDICQGSTPCGWAVYHVTSRYITYFMRNECECPKGKECIRSEDDISIKAYVYRCLHNNVKEDTS